MKLVYLFFKAKFIFTFYKRNKNGWREYLLLGAVITDRLLAIVLLSRLGHKLHVATAPYFPPFFQLYRPLEQDLVVTLSVSVAALSARSLTYFFYLYVISGSIRFQQLFSFSNTRYRRCTNSLDKYWPYIHTFRSIHCTFLVISVLY